MADWLTLVPGIGIALALFFIPGTVVGWCMRLPHRWVLASGPLISTTIVATAAIVAPWLNISWGIRPVLYMTVALGAIGALIAWFTRTSTRLEYVDFRTGQDNSRPSVIPPLVTWAIVAFVTAAVLALAIGRPDRFAGSFDTSFHLNSIDAIARSGNASSLEFTTASVGTSPVFYPGAWHAFVSLVYQYAGVGIPAVTNIVTFVVAAVIWPAAMATFARAVFQHDNIRVCLAIAFSVIVPHFPYGLLGWGILYPNFLALAVLPSLLALTVYFFRFKLDHRYRIRMGLAILGCIPGIALAQPNAVFTYGIFVLVMIVAGIWTRSLHDRKARKSPLKLARPWLLLVGGLVAMSVAMSQIPVLAGLRSQSYWDPDTDVNQVLGDFFTNRMPGTPSMGFAGVFFSVLWMIGLIALWKWQRHRWLVITQIVLLFLYLLSRTLEGPLRPWILGIWYSDTYRLSAVIPLTQVLLMAVGMSVLYNHIKRRLPLHVGGLTIPEGMTRVVVIGLVTLLGAQSMALSRMPVQAMFTPRTFYLSEKEQDFMYEALEIVPDGEVIANNPWDGSAIIPSVSNDRVLFTHIQTSQSPLVQLLRTDLYQALSEPQVCEAVRRLNVHWIIDLGEPMWPDDPRAEEYMGISRAFIFSVSDTVLSRDGMRLARITACR